jgi:hypothetical protein
VDTSHGKLRVELGNRSAIEDVRENGEADFKGIPSRFRGSTIRVLPQIEGFQQEYQNLRLTSDVVDLDLKKADPVTHKD